MFVEDAKIIVQDSKIVVQDVLQHAKIVARSDVGRAQIFVQDVTHVAMYLGSLFRMQHKLPNTGKKGM